MKRRTLAFILAFAAATPAYADEAADRVARATRYYNIQEWSRALKEYREAYALDPRPETLWAIAQTQRLSGDCRAAILSYKAYLRGASASGANAAMDWIKACEADLEAQRRSIEDATAAAPPPVAPAAPQVRAASPAPARRRSWVLDPVGDVLFVAGVGGLGAGAAYVVLGVLELRSAPHKATAGDYARAVNRGHSDRTIGVISGAAGAVLLGAAIWRFSSAASAAERGAASSFGVVPTADGAVASYAGRF